MTTFSDVQQRLATWRTQEPSVRPPDIYVGLVIAAGMGLLLESVYALAIRPPDLGWALLVLLSIGSAQLMLRMPAVPVSFSVSDIFTFTAALMYGPAAGALAAAIDAAVLSTRLVSSGRSTTRYLFNVSAVTLAMWVAACWFFLLSGTTALAADPSAIISHVGSLAAFALLYFALNTGLVAAAIALATRRSLWQVWCAHFLSLWPGYVGGAAASGLALFLFSTRHGDFRVLAFVLPMPFILYITFKTVGRADAGRRRAFDAHKFDIPVDHRGARPGGGRQGPGDARAHPAGAAKCHAARARAGASRTNSKCGQSRPRRCCTTSASSRFPSTS